MFDINDIDDYQSRLTEKQKKQVVKHCNRYGMTPNICAWYDDWEDFCSDWCDEIGYTRTEARELLHGGEGQFQIFSDESIIRFVL